MRRKTFTVLFFIKRTKLLSNGEAPIYMRVTVDGIRAEMSIQRSTKIVEWIDKKGCVRSTTSKNKELNHIRHKMYQIQKELADEGKRVTSAMMKNKYAGIDNKNISFVELYAEHNKKWKN